jgi:uncharacterized protein (UPF0332 family)
LLRDGFYRDAFNIRNDSDYEDHFVISKFDVAVQIDNASLFLAAVEKYINGIKGFFTRQD